MSGAYYNEIDPGAAEWLRELIRRGLIADGEVDERSIEDVCPVELLGYSQCHFFAGMGGWSYALRLAGWPDDRPVWTGSCPCQPFSAAGKGTGFADERHLWPAFHWLIAQCGPDVVFGEQVAGKDGLAWLDLVSTDLEALGYTCGAVPFPAAGIGAPHIRERLYWVADAERNRSASRVSAEARGHQGVSAVAGDRRNRQPRPHTGRPLAGGMELPESDGRQQWRAQSGGRSTASGCGDGGLADLSGKRWNGRQDPSWANGGIGPEASGEIGRASPTNGVWRSADWLGCRDDRWRPVEPGSFPLAHGLPARVGRLRGYGNAIVATQAQAFIEAYLEAAA